MARILVVDDNETDRYLEHTILEDAGHEILFAKDGGDALRVFHSYEIAVVVTDLRMPLVDGLELIRKIREEDAQIPIVAVSGIGSEKLREARDLGADLSLFKPVEPDKLIEAVNQALSGVQKDVWGPG
jgi:CheY-like chemotaxis protein